MWKHYLFMNFIWGTLFRNKQESYFDICYVTGEPGGCSKWNNPDLERQTLHDVLLTVISQPDCNQVEHVEVKGWIKFNW